jgi:antitoxin ParD1/3/4
MPDVEKLSVALPADMAGLIRDAIESGDYATTGEVIREALRDWEQKRRLAVREDDQLRHLVGEGMESGRSVPADRVFDRLQAKYGAIRQAE